MRKNLLKGPVRLLTFCGISLWTCILASCSEGESGKEPYVLQQSDITVNEPEGGFTALVDQLFHIEVSSVSDEGVTYSWMLDGESIPGGKTLDYMFSQSGEYTLALTASQRKVSYTYTFTVMVVFGEADQLPESATAYITKVLDYMPAVGQFTNTMPAYEDGDTQETMNQKVLDAIGNNNRGTISLGGFGGYVVVGFDHTIENREGLRDFRVLGNAFYSATNPEPDAPQGGNCEPGIIMVAYDKNKNGQPDEDEWYEIAGSAHEGPAQESWYQMAVNNGNDVSLYRNYEITYYRPNETMDSSLDVPLDEYIRWEDNQGHSGYKVKNIYHNQPYFPQWYEGDELTFRGTCLPQNGIDESGQGNYFVLYKFRYGYADNETNNADESSIDIDWAVNSKGQYVSLPGVDFIKIYCGVNQENGWLGECSTEVSGVEDLHLLGEEIPTRE